MTLEPWTEKGWELRDPQRFPPPLKHRIWCLTSGGRLIEAEWSDEYLAWAPYPKVPETVKERIRASLVTPPGR